MANAMRWFQTGGPSFLSNGSCGMLYNIISSAEAGAAGLRMGQVLSINWRSTLTFSAVPSWTFRYAAFAGQLSEL